MPDFHVHFIDLFLSRWSGPKTSHTKQWRILKDGSMENEHFDICTNMAKMCTELFNGTYNVQAMETQKFQIII